LTSNPTKGEKKGERGGAANPISAICSRGEGEGQKKSREGEKSTGPRPGGKKKGKRNDLFLLAKEIEPKT